MRYEYWTQPRRVLQPLMREIDGKNLRAFTLVEQARSVGAEVLLVNTGGFSAWYPSRLESQRVNKHLAPEFFAELVECCHSQGMKLIARMDISKGYPEWLKAHPEWFSYRPDGSPDMVWAMPQTCFTGPYWQDENFKILDEILANYDVDGFFYNYYHVAPCYCPRCREMFRADTGKELPAPGSTTPEYERWRQRLLADYTKRVRRFIHERSERAVLIPYHHVRDGWDYRAMAEAGDIISAQASNPLVVNPINPQPRWNHWGAEEVLLARAARPEYAPLVVNSCSEFFASRQTAMPGDRLIRDLIQVAAHGGSTCPAINGTLDQADARTVPAIKKIGNFLAENAEWYQGLRSVAKVAIIRSGSSVLWGPDNGQPAGNPARPGHVAEYRGIYEIMVRLRYPADMLPAGGLSFEELRRYGVVILPAVSCISDQDAQALEKYVSSGGCLIATADTGARDEDGRARKAPAPSCLPALPAPPRNVSGAYLELVSAGLRTWFGGIPHIGVDGEFFGGTGGNPAAGDDLLLIGPFKNNAPEFTFWEGHGTDAGMVALSFGDGRVVWLPWRVGGLYHMHGIPEYVTLFGYLLNEAIGEPPVKTSAPGAVEFVLYAHPKGMVLHIINGAAPQGGPVVEVTPLAGFDVRVKCGAARARRLDTQSDIPITCDGEEVGFNLERLDSFAAIVLER